MVKEGIVTFAVEDQEKYFQKETLNHFGYDPFTLSNEYDPAWTQINMWPLIKGWPLKAAVDDVILRLHEGGIVAQMRKRSYMTWMPRPPLEELRPISIDHLLVCGVTPFILGLLISLVMFFVEMKKADK